MLRNVPTKIILLGLIIIVIGCDLPHQPGPMPRDLIETKFEPGLNIFCVLRADDIPGSSFCLVEKALTTQEMYEDTNYVVSDASILINDPETNRLFAFTPEIDSMRGRIFTNLNFVPTAGRTYQITVSAPGFADVTAETVVPSRPEIDPASQRLQANKLEFDLLARADVYLYEIALIFFSQRITLEKPVHTDEVIHVKIDFAAELGPPLFLGIYAYDANLAEYLSASPSLIPQTYHEIPSTVEDGYGCLGSLAVTLVPLNQ